MFLSILVMGSAASIVNGVSIHRRMLSRQDEELWVQAAVQCRRQSGLEDETKMAFNFNIFKEKHEEVDFLYCLFTRLGLAYPNGDINVQKFLYVYPDNEYKHLVYQFINECKHNDEDPKMRISRFFKCYLVKLNMSPEGFIMPSEYYPQQNQSSIPNVQVTQPQTQKVQK